MWAYATFLWISSSLCWNDCEVYCLGPKKFCEYLRPGAKSVACVEGAYVWLRSEIGNGKGRKKRPLKGIKQLFLGWVGFGDVMFFCLKLLGNRFCCQMFDISKYVFEVVWYSSRINEGSGWLPCPSEMFFSFNGENGRMITQKFR